MKKYVYVVVDTNDADYISDLNEITDESKYDVDGIPMTIDNQIALLTKVANAIKTCKSGYNWWNIYTSASDREKSPEELYDGILSKKEIQWFEEWFTPHGHDGFHSIDKIKILDVEKLYELL